MAPVAVALEDGDITLLEDRYGSESRLALVSGF